MASRMKKIFHRKKDEDVEVPTPHTRAPATGSSDPAMRTSLYESTTAGGLPQTGDYPIKTGRRSSMRSMRSRRSSSSQYNTPYQAPAPHQNDVARSTPRMSPPPSSINIPGSYDTYDPYHDSSSPMSGHDDRRRRLSRSSLPQDFAGLNLGNGQGPTTVTSTVTTTRFGPQGSHANRGAPQAQGYTGQDRDIGYGTTSRNIEPQSPYANRGITQAQGNASQNDQFGHGTNQDTQPSRSYANRNAPQNQGSAGQGRSTGFGPTNLEAKSPVSYAERGHTQTQGYSNQSKGNARTANDGDYQQPAASKLYQREASSNARYNEPNALGGRDGYQDLARHKSIPRKQLGTSAQEPSSYVQPPTSSSPHISHSRQQNDSKPLPSAPISSTNDYGDRGTAATPHPSSILDRSRPISKGYAAPRDGQDVIDRAKSNTYDTDVIEIVAPAVVHENVTKDVHHIREEVITREVHTHDVYHRILPIVDIEVLPPRHFLPVEGGGLVEVSAAEVPGRGHNWVIAETASKIPSDQAAPQGRRRFTAREFPGQEGDAVKYMTPDGYEKTEETWVHPPELEEGARLTGQSWPMVFGDDSASKATYADATSSQTNRKSPKKGQATQASPAQRAGGFGRTAQSSIA